MSLFLNEEEKDAWRGMLERRFIAAHHTEREYLDGARQARNTAVAWVKSDSRVKGSFLWVCDALNLEPDAVRKAINAKKKLPLLADLL